MKKYFVLAILSIALSSCQIEDGTKQPNYPVIKIEWDENIRGRLTPYLFNDLITAQEDDLSKLGAPRKGQIAFNLKTKKLAWERLQTKPGDGMSTVVYKGKAISFNATGVIRVLNDDGTIYKTIDKMIEPDREGGGDLSTTRVELYKNIVVIPLRHYVVAYNADQLVDETKDPQPIWQYAKKTENESNYQILVSNRIDPTTGVAYLLHNGGDLGEYKATNYFTAVDILTGKELWRKLVFFSTRDIDRSGVVGANNGMAVFHLNGTNQVIAYNTNGQKLWESEDMICPKGETSIFSSLLVQDDFVVASPFGDNCLTVLEANSGKKRFAFVSPLDATFDQIPLVLNGVMYANNSYLWAVDIKTGQILGRSARMDNLTQGNNGTTLHDQATNQLLVWGERLTAYTPVR